MRAYAIACRDFALLHGAQISEFAYCERVQVRRRLRGRRPSAQSIQFTS